MKRRNMGKKFGGSFVAGAALVASSAQAALDAAAITALQTAVLSDVGLAAAVGVAIMTVVLGWDVGISLVKKFTKKGAS